MEVTNNEDRVLKGLAIAIVDKPRSTMKELAEAVGMSKASIHRIYGTRENLQQLLEKKALEVIEDIITVAKQDCRDYVFQLRTLISVHYDNKEYIRMMCSLQSCIENDYWMPYFQAIEDFFLRGQKGSAFRIDLSSLFLSESFVYLVNGAIDAERRGRVASTSVISSIESFMLYGISIFEGCNDTVN